MRSVILIFCLVFVVNIVSAQEISEERKIGLSTSLLKEQMDISVPIFTSEYYVVVPSVKILYVEDGGLDFGIGAAVKYYFRNTKVAPYMTGRISAFGLNPKRGHSMMDYGLGFGMGADYFFDPNFSVGLEAQLNGTFSDKNSNRFGNPGGTNLNTAMAVTASIYLF